MAARLASGAPPRRAFSSNGVLPPLETAPKGGQIGGTGIFIQEAARLRRNGMTQASSQAAPDHEPAGPLAGVRVLDLSRLVAGNMLSLQLADFGTEVIKLEPGKGDPLRDWQEEGISAWWQVYGRNKRSIRMELRDPEGKRRLTALLPTAQVLVEAPDAGTGTLPMHAPFPRLSRTPGSLRRQAPALGQDEADILGTLG